MALINDTAHAKRCPTGALLHPPAPSASLARPARLFLAASLLQPPSCPLSGWGYMPAREYADMVHTMVSNMDPPLQPGESVYELACGTGAALSFLRDYLHAGVVGGVDASQNAIAYARSSLPEHASRFAVQNMTAPNSAVAAGAFDHTIAIGGLAMYLGRRDMMRAITEAVRVTKPGGSLLLSHFIEELGAPRGQIVEPVPKDFWPSALATLGLERIRIRPVPHHSQGDRYYITAVKRGPAGLNAHRRKRLMEAGGDGLSGQDLSLQHARHIAVDEHVVAGMDTCIRDLALKLRSALEDAKIW